MFRYRFGDQLVLHDTIIAHIPFSVYGKLLPIFFTTFATTLLLCPQPVYNYSH